MAETKIRKGNLDKVTVNSLSTLMKGKDPFDSTINKHGKDKKRWWRIYNAR